jgi:hypothetical protein
MIQLNIFNILEQGSNMKRRQSKAETKAEGGVVNAITADIKARTKIFTEDEKISSALTGRQRQGLYSAGVRNYGFIEKAYGIARMNPAFLPPFFDAAQMGVNVRKLKDLRRLSAAVEQLQQAVRERMLITADACYREALRVYSSLQEQSKNKVPGAKALYDAVTSFFRRKKSDGQAAQKELERDGRALIKGAKDGKLIIENYSPKVKGGARRIVDGVRRGKTAFKYSEEGGIKE